MNKLISVIIPAYNEEDYIKETILAIIKWKYPTEIVIVDDGSKDSTPEIVESLMDNQNIKLIKLLHNIGKGGALMAGLEKASGDIYLFIDADLGNTAFYASQLLPPIIEENIDMTIAVLPRSNKKAGFGLVKSLAAKGIKTLTGYKTSAPLSGQRAIKKEVLKEISSLAKGFGIEVGLTIDVIKKGYKIKEVEIPLAHRETGRDLQGFLHRGREFIAVLRALVFSFRKYKIK